MGENEQLLKIDKALIKLFPKDSFLNSSELKNSEDSFHFHKLNLIGDFERHTFSFVFEVPPSVCLDLMKGVNPVQSTSNNDFNGEDPVSTFEFGQHSTIGFNLPIDLELYKLSASTWIHFRAVISGSNASLQIFHQIRASKLSLAIVNERGEILQQEKFAYCQSGSRGGLCFRLRNFLDLSVGGSMLTKSGSFLLRILFSGMELSPNIEINEELERDEDEVRASRTLLFTSEQPQFYIRQTLLNYVNANVKGAYVKNWTEKNSDSAKIKIRLQNKDKKISIIPAHYAFLSAQSDGFGGFLQNPKEESIVVMEGYSESNVTVLLSYIYSGQLHTSNLLELVTLIEMSSRYKIYGLKEKCIGEILSLVDICNVTNVRHIAALYKLGEVINEVALMDKGVEAFRDMKYCDDCFDFVDGEELLEIAGLTEDEFNRVLPILHDKSTPKNESIKNLVSFPADEVKYIGSCSECWNGYILVFPVDLLLKMKNETMLTPKFELAQNLDQQMHLELIVNPTGNGMNLRITSNESVDTKITPDLKRFLSNLKIEKHDYCSLVAESMGIELEATLFHASGKIITSRQTRGIFTDADYEFWEISSFLTTKILDLEWDGKTELVLRIAFGIHQVHPTLSQISTMHPQHGHFKKFNADFLQVVHRDSFSSRILKQFGNSATSDSYFCVLDKKQMEVKLKIPIHIALFSAISPKFDETLKVTAQLNILESDFSESVIQSLLLYIYNGDFEIEKLGDASELLLAAKEFKLIGLEEKILNKLCLCQLDLETGIHFYQIGMETQYLPLLDVTLKYFKRNVETLAEFDEFQELLHHFPKILQFIQKSN